MKTLKVVVSLGIVLSLLGGSLRATELGDPAPALKIAKWIKGEAVDLDKGKGKNVYVVEFWATWCGPCRTSIPHLSELAKKYRDRGVLIVGITDERNPDQISEFVQKMGDNMDYVVAQDDEMKTFELYMKAFNQNGIPHAFVVDKDGRIVWHGHPMANLDKVIDAVLAGTHSIEKAKAEARQIEEGMQLVGKVREYFTLRRKNQQLGDKLLEDLKGNAIMLNQLAWLILTEEGIRARDLDLAMRVAKAAYDACEGKDAAIVDTYARALYDTGKRKEALEYQRKAVELATDQETKAELKKTLEEYEKALTPVTL